MVSHSDTRVRQIERGIFQRRINVEVILHVIVLVGVEVLKKIRFSDCR